MKYEEYTNSKILENGYDYLSNNELGIWLETENAEEAVALVVELIKNETILDNDLTKSTEISISSQKCAEIEGCKKVFPI